MPDTVVRTADRFDIGLRTKRHANRDCDSDANGYADADAQRMSGNHHGVAGTFVDPHR